MLVGHETGQNETVCMKANHIFGRDLNNMLALPLLQNLEAVQELSVSEECLQNASLTAEKRLVLVLEKFESRSDGLG